MNIILSMVLQHTIEASFLWLLRDMAVEGPQYSLKDLAKLDMRVEAHIDGLRVAADEGWKICKEELSWEEPGEVFSASVLAFESGIEERINDVLSVGAQNHELSKGITSALGWIPFSVSKKYIDTFCCQQDPALLLIGLSASAVHRQNLPEEVLIKALGQGDKPLKIRALEALGELGKVDMMDHLRMNFEDTDPVVSFTAARSACILGNQNAPYLLKLILDELDKPLREEAVRVAFRKMNLRDSEYWLDELKQTKDKLNLAVIGAGAIGDPVYIPWLIEMMGIKELCRKAGESFSMITGVDLAYSDLDGKLPEGFDTGPNEDPEDENVQLDPDEDLPVPDAKKVKAWWEKNKSRFKSGNRYLTGHVIGEQWLNSVLLEGRQRQRMASAMEKAMMSPGQPLFNVKAPGFQQEKLLQEKLLTIKNLGK